MDEWRGEGRLMGRADKCNLFDSFSGIVLK